MKKILFFSILIIMGVLNATCWAGIFPSEEEQQKWKEAQKALETDNPLYKEAQRLLETEYYSMKQVKEVGGLHPYLNAHVSGNEALLSILRANTLTIDTFLKATRQTSDGLILAKAPAEMSSASAIPNYFKYLEIINLVLLQTRLSMENGDYQKVEENILSTLDFVIHLSEQKPPFLMNHVIFLIIQEKVDPFIVSSLKGTLYNKRYYQELVHKLQNYVKVMDLKVLTEETIPLLYVIL